MEFMNEVIARSPHLEESARDVYESASHISAKEIIGDEEFPQPYVDVVAEWVGDWIASSYTLRDDDDYSDLCCVFYEAKGCLDLHGDAWNEFWMNQW